MIPDRMSHPAISRRSSRANGRSHERTAKRLSDGTVGRQAATSAAAGSAEEGTKGGAGQHVAGARGRLWRADLHDRPVEVHPKAGAVRGTAARPRPNRLGMQRGATGRERGSRTAIPWHTTNAWYQNPRANPSPRNADVPRGRYSSTRNEPGSAAEWEAAGSSTARSGCTATF